MPSPTLPYHTHVLPGRCWVLAPLCLLVSERLKVYWDPPPPPLYCELTDKWAKTAVTQEDNPA